MSATATTERCVWCDSPIATAVEFDMEHDDVACNNAPTECWCKAFCWEEGGYEDRPCDHLGMTARGLVKWLRFRIANGS